MLADSLTVALAQVLPGPDVEPLIEQAAGDGADILVFPEMFSNGYSRYEPNDDARATWIAAAEPTNGPYIERYRTLAVRHGIAIVATLLEAGTDASYNTAVLIDRHGQTILQQRKRHICFFGNPEDACAGGDRSEVVLLETAAGTAKIGLMICMDREFPEVATDLMTAGAEAILIPNSCALVNDPEIGDVRLAGIRATAHQTVTCLAVANYPSPKDDGHSCAVDELGRVIAMADEQSGLLIARFDLTRLRATQKQEWFRRKR